MDVLKGAHTGMTLSGYTCQ